MHSGTVLGLEVSMKRLKNRMKRLKNRLSGSVHDTFMFDAMDIKLFGRFGKHVSFGELSLAEGIIHGQLGCVALGELL